MKKILSVMLAAMMVFTLAACGSTQETSEPSDSASQPENSTSSESSTPSESEAPTESEAAGQSDHSESSSGSNILVAYFSQTGNTESIANQIAEQTGGDLFKIETVQTYPDNHMDLIAFAQDEQNENARPELTANIENMDDYDVVFVGYPNWWADMPMAVYTFLESHDWNGKTVIPFCTHGGSGLSRTESTIAEICSGAELMDGLAVSDTNIDGAGPDVENWLNGLGY